MDVVRQTGNATALDAVAARELSSVDDLRGAVRPLVDTGRYDDAWQLVRPYLRSGDDHAAWGIGRRVVQTGAAHGWAPPARRTIRLAVLCTYEPAELVESLGLACAAVGLHAELYAAPYGQLEQEALLEGGALSEFRPTHVLLAPTTADVGFPPLSDDVEPALAAELRRWQTLWDALAGAGARVVQHGFVVPEESPLGHLALRVPGSRLSLVRKLNARLGEAAGSSVLLVDVERLAAGIGKRRWTDPRLWHAARLPCSYAALPALARATAAVLAGDVGLAPRCLVLDLDNTLWGGVVGEVGGDGVAIGVGPDGEAYAAFHEYLLALRERGVLLAVASKNDLDAAREPFEANPHMGLRLEHFAAFVADWRPKSEQVREIAETLGLGLDSLVLLDDNPAECAEVAGALPAVLTVPLTVPPAEFVRMLEDAVPLEAPALTAEDRARADSYTARQRAESLRAEAPTLPDFWRSLEMRARIRPVDGKSLARAAQLTQKTNQFNLTLTRRSEEQLSQLLREPDTVARTLQLEDRFARHGIVGLVLAVPDEAAPEALVIDTLLLSCRVIGRTAERHLLAHVARAAATAGYERLIGTYVPGPRNSLVADLYPTLGFADVADGRWEFDLANELEPSAYIADE